jgi:hypothetical protein
MLLFADDPTFGATPQFIENDPAKAIERAQTALNDAIAAKPIDLGVFLNSQDNQDTAAGFYTLIVSYARLAMGQQYSFRFTPYDPWNLEGLGPV